MSVTLKAKLLQVTLVVLCLVLMFPFAMSSSKYVALALYFVTVASAILFVFRSTVISRKLLVISFFAFALVFLIPADVALVRGDAFRIAWIRNSDENATIPITVWIDGVQTNVFIPEHSHPDMTIGVRPRGVVQVVIPCGKDHTGSTPGS